MSKFDVAVIGLGAMGAATLYHLAKAGVNAVGIDQFAPPHTEGSTHGETRVTRCAIGEGHQYVPLALRSHEIWKELEKECGEQLLFETGALMVEDGDAAGDVHGASDFIDTTISAAQIFGIEHEVLSPEQSRERFPQFKVADKDKVYFEPGAGYLKVEECVAAQLRRAGELGADIRTNHRVKAIEDDSDGVTIETDKGTIHAQKVVVCAGAWAKELLGAPFDQMLTTTRQVLHWFPFEDAHKEQWQDHPLFIWVHGAGDGFYGLPSLAEPNLLKVANAGYGGVITPQSIDRNVSPQEANQMHAQHVKDRLAGIGDGAAKSVTCLYTITPDSDFIIDWHPTRDNIFVISACSGHGFKHSTAIGEAAAQIMARGKSEIDLSKFQISRFSV